VGRLELRGVEVKTRRLWFVFLFALGTLGLYYWVWYYRVHAELQGYGRTEEGVDAAELGGIDPARSALAVSIGWWLLVPPFVSQWRFYKRIRLAQGLAGVQEHERVNHALGFALFLLAFFLLPFEIAYAQLHLNRLWRRLQVEEEKAALGMRSVAAADERSRAVRRQRQERERHRRRWLVRGVVLLNLALIGSIAVRGRPASVWFYATRHDAFATLGKGLLVGLAVFLVIATLGYFITRRGLYTDWGEVAFGKPVLIATFFLLVFGAGFRVASHEAAVSSAVPNINGSEVQRERAQRDAADWSTQMASLPRETNAAFRDIRTVGSLLNQQGNSVRALALNRDAERHFAHVLAAARGIPDYPEADLNDLRDSLVGLLVLRHRAAQLYVRALEDNARRHIPLTQDTQARALLNEGDRLLDRAEKQEPALVARIKRMNRRYSTSG
jgi:hypothetical protein